MRLGSIGMSRPIPIHIIGVLLSPLVGLRGRQQSIIGIMATRRRIGAGQIGYSEA
jgi:hypothetical protein